MTRTAPQPGAGTREPREERTEGWGGGERDTLSPPPQTHTPQPPPPPQNPGKEGRRGAAPHPYRPPAFSHISPRLFPYLPPPPRTPLSPLHHWRGGIRESLRGAGPAPPSAVQGHGRERSWAGLGWTGSSPAFKPRPDPPHPAPNSPPSIPSRSRPLGRCSAEHPGNEKLFPLAWIQAVPGF